ncbi:MAG: hypothetical protein M5U26_26945 [Planctomycetota bacterium]|nr:hypothetical protein [Planctomycetota bacterium]
MISSRTLPVLLALLALGASSARAESKGDDEKDTYRYEVIKVDGEIYKFDKKTGELIPLKAGAPAKRPEPVESTKESARPEPRKNGLPVLGGVEDAAPGEAYVPRALTDVHRTRAKDDLAAYRDNLGILSVLDISGDRLRGTLNVSNKGQRKLLALELTISMVDGGGQKVEHRVVMGPHPGQEPPPQPSRQQGEESKKAYLRVDFPAPAGLRGKISVDPTYIKFDEEE